MALPLSYNVRNLRVRWQVTLLAIFGIALVVTVFVFLAAMSSGFRIALRSTGRDDNAIVLQKGSTSELGSGIERGKAGLLMVDARIARDPDGQPLASGEILSVANLKRLDGGEVNVTIRGVSAKTFDGARGHPHRPRPPLHSRPRRGRRGRAHRRPLRLPGGHQGQAREAGVGRGRASSPPRAAASRARSGATSRCCRSP